MLMYKAFTFRLYPNKIQKELIDKTFGCSNLSIIIILIRLNVINMIVPILKYEKRIKRLQRELSRNGDKF